MIENNKVKYASLVAVVVILFLTVVTAAQTPVCTTRSMEIGTVLTPGPLLKPGHQVIWVGKKTPPKGTVTGWKSFGPFGVSAGIKYLAVITNGTISGLRPNDVALNSYPNPAGNMAAIYFLSKTSDGAWYSVCTRWLEPVKPSRAGSE